MTGLIRKKPMLSRNNARLKKRRAAQFGEQAAVSRVLPCCVCMPGLFAAGNLAETIERAREDGVRRSDPHHTLSRGAGGVDEHCVPLCRRHHNELDSPWSGPKTFEATHDINLRQLAAALHEQITRSKQDADT